MSRFNNSASTQAHIDRIADDELIQKNTYYLDITEYIKQSLLVRYFISFLEHNGKISDESIVIF